MFEAGRPGGSSPCENHWIARDGQQRAIRWVNTVLRDAGGEPELVIGTGPDITDEERLADEIRNIQRLESLARLAGGIAHDFNNLLMAPSAASRWREPR